MSPDRRYNEEEIAAIFKQAASDQEIAQRKLGHGEGLTLGELKEIGKEAGITPEFIARAAAAIAPPTTALPTTSYLGIPVTAGRTVELPGPLSDEAWDQLVVDLRETFHATGKTRRDGGHREWRNGNLRVLVESTQSGHQLRLHTLNGNQRSMLLTGLGVFAMNLVFLLIMATSGKFGMTPDVLLLASLGAFGAGAAGLAAYVLPRWADERGRQMDLIAASAVKLASAPSSTVGQHTPSGRIDLDTTLQDEMAPARSQQKSRS